MPHRLLFQPSHRTQRREIRRPRGSALAPEDSYTGGLRSSEVACFTGRVRLGGFPGRVNNGPDPIKCARGAGVSMSPASHSHNEYASTENSFRRRSPGSGLNRAGHSTVGPCRSFVASPAGGDWQKEKDYQSEGATKASRDQGFWRLASATLLVPGPSEIAAETR